MTSTPAIDAPMAALLVKKYAIRKVSVEAIILQVSVLTKLLSLETCRLIVC